MDVCHYQIFLIQIVFQIQWNIYNDKWIDHGGNVEQGHHRGAWVSNLKSSGVTDGKGILEMESLPPKQTRTEKVVSIVFNG